MWSRGILGVLVILPGGFLPRGAQAGEFHSTVDHATVLFDAPSTKANKVSLLGRDYPVEVIVSVQGWAKVRDATGALSWVQKTALGDKRMVVVRVNVAPAYAAPDSASPLVFNAEQGVLLELLDPNAVAGFVKIRHHDGQVGYMRVGQLWGL